MEATMKYAREEPDFLEFHKRAGQIEGKSTLYITPAIIGSTKVGKTQTVYAYGKITIAYHISSGGEKSVEYEIQGDEVFINGQKCIDTPIYIREPDYLYMVKPYRSFRAFKEQFDKGKFYRRWKTPIPSEATSVVRHFEIYFGKSISDVYVLFDGEVYSEPKKNSYGDIVEMNIGWRVKSRVSDKLLDDLEILIKRGKEPILLTDVQPEEPEPEPESEFVVVSTTESHEPSGLNVYGVSFKHPDPSVGIDDWTPKWKETRPPFGFPDPELDAM